MKKIKNEHIYNIKVPSISECWISESSQEYMYFTEKNFYNNIDNVITLNYCFSDFELYFRINKNVNSCTIIYSTDLDDDFDDMTKV